MHDHITKIDKHPFADALSSTPSGRSPCSLAFINTLSARDFTCRLEVPLRSQDNP